MKDHGYDMKDQRLTTYMKDHGFNIYKEVFKKSIGNGWMFY